MPRAACCCAVLLLGASALRAADFAIDLTARAGKESRSAEAVPPGAKPPTRGVLMAASDTPITLRWTVRNRDKEATVKDVLVHALVVKEERLDQPEVPKLTKGVVVESALTMDFKAQDRSEGEVTFRVPQAGCYLIRLELKGVARNGEREPFAALDLLAR